MCESLEFGLTPNGSASCKLPYGPVRGAITSAVCELKAQLQLEVRDLGSIWAIAVHLSLRSDVGSNVGQVPGSEVHWATGLPTGSTFDYRTLMARGCIDLVLNMDYCACSKECIANKMSNPSEYPCCSFDIFMTHVFSE